MNNFFSTLKPSLHTILSTLFLSVKKTASAMRGKLHLTKKTTLPDHTDPVVQKKKLFMRLSLKDRIMFIKRLSILIRAGVPLFSALDVLKKQSRSRTMNRVMDQIIKDVENGQYLATTLGKFKKIFGELTINIIAIGEISGNLSKNLDHLALTLKKNQALKRTVISASVYPIFIIIITLAMTVMLTVFVFPKIIPVFKSLNYQLPWTTRFLIFISNVAQTHGICIIIGIAVCGILFWLLLRVKKIRFLVSQALIKTPLIGRFIQTYHVTNICRTIGLLLHSGVSVVRTLHISSETTVNVLYKRGLATIENALTKGEIISTQMERAPTLFPVTMSQMVAVGESTGQLSETFTYLADIYEEEIDELTKNLSTTIEPLLLIFMGILVGFIAISIITPIYGITQHLNPR